MRDLDPGPPWDYANLVRVHAAASRAALDLGTGGGELLAALRTSLPERVVATESWSVNVPVAYRRLTPLRVRVVRAHSMHLPFRPASFDLVLDRHEEFDPEEVDRILAPGGTFITQQVGPHDWQELRAFFPRMAEVREVHAADVAAFRGRGFRVEGGEHDHRVAYPSLGAFVFMLALSPWTIPAFDVERDLEALLAFEAEHGTEDGIAMTECRSYLVARKPR